MSERRDFYEVLEVKRGAGGDELRRAHRRLARKYHPDVNKSPDAAARFAEIQEAYDTLSDDEKRQAYDRFGHAGVGIGGERGGGGRGTGPWRTSGSSGAEAIDPEAFASIFEELFSDQRGSAFSSRPRSGQRRAEPMRGADVQQTITITFMTAALGGVEKLYHADRGGDQQDIEVRIPPGIESGARLRVRGRGGPGSADGTAGDIILTVQVGEHPYFRREGLDVLMDVPITIAEAVLGVTVTVPLLQGAVEIKIPPGASSGRKLRVKGRGVIDSKGRSGDFFAVVQIAAPDELSDSDRRTLSDLSRRLKNPRESSPWFRGGDGGSRRRADADG